MQKWNRAQKPFRIFANSYYVGTRGLSSILITSAAGHVLIDGALPESAPQIAANIQTLGFRIQDVKVILNSHVHFDHAGGIAQLQRLGGARVIASEWSAQVMKEGGIARDDPQYGETRGIAPIRNVRILPNLTVLRPSRRADSGLVALANIPERSRTSKRVSNFWKQPRAMC